MVLAKLTSKNHLTLPKAVRARLKELGITDADVAAAVAWARQA